MEQVYDDVERETIMVEIEADRAHVAAVRELVLAVTNDGAIYRANLDAVHLCAGPAASYWVRVVTNQANELYWGKAYDEGTLYTAADILCAAAEVAVYYAEHVKELEAPSS